MKIDSVWKRWGSRFMSKNFKARKVGIKPVLLCIGESDRMGGTNLSRTPRMK